MGRRPSGIDRCILRARGGSSVSFTNAAGNGTYSPRTRR